MSECRGGTYPLAIVVEEGLELDNVGVPDDAHDLQFTVLLEVSTDALDKHVRAGSAHLETLVLEYTLDSGILPTR